MTTVHATDRRAAILEAATHLVAESGLDGFSMDDLAARAGVGKATIYRNWRSRAELLVELCSASSELVPAPANGNLRDDLIEAAARQAPDIAELIQLYYRQDPHLMRPSFVLKLSPRPDYVVYQ